MVRPASDASLLDLPGYRDFVAIARSRTSEIYRARQEGVDRPVAVKVLLPDDEEAVARFQRELEITVQLGRQHPHIVAVIATGVSRGGQPCIVMEYYDNGSLHDRLSEQGPLPWSEALAAGIAVADALAFAHRNGVLHRDVKPQNILILPTSYVVADFGIARRVDSAHTSSVDWFSFRHAAPQVLDGGPPSVADDIWSFGSTLYTLLDGRSPFAADNAEDDTPLPYMKRVRTSRPRPLHRPDVPSGMIAIIDRCLRYDPADRFPDVDSLLRALNDLVDEQRARVRQHASALPSLAAPHAGSEMPAQRPDALAPSAPAHLPRQAGVPRSADEPPTGRRPRGVKVVTKDGAPGARPRVLTIGMLAVPIGVLLAIGVALLTVLPNGQLPKRSPASPSNPPRPHPRSRRSRSMDRAA